MNVNPFSYLIEKLKGKVNKSGDTMTGTLTINTGSGESHAILGGSNSNGVLELKSKTNNKTMYILTVDLANNHAIQFPDKDGTVALTSDVEKCECLVVSASSVASLPVTISNANIESDMIVANSTLSNPSAQLNDWTVTTASGTATISGTISGTTNITLYLMKSR